MTDYQRVAQAHEIPENSSKAVDVAGVAVLLCNVGGEFFAVENRCPHQNQPLAGGRIRNGYIFCPLHGMRFKLATGEAIGQLTNTPVKVFNTRLINGEVYAQVENS